MKPMPLEEIFFREAERLRSMADAFVYYSARDEFLRIAGQFEALALRHRQPDTTLPTAPCDTIRTPRLAST
jgi:hypothetical protein